jgi:hypothetical protein
MKREKAAARDAKEAKVNASHDDSWDITFDLDSQSLHTSRVRIATSNTGFMSTITYDQGCKQKSGDDDELIDMSHDDENDEESVSLELQSRKRTHAMLGEDSTTLHFSCHRCSTKSPRCWPRADPDQVKWKW